MLFLITVKQQNKSDPVAAESLSIQIIRHRCWNTGERSRSERTRSKQRLWRITRIYVFIIYRTESYVKFMRMFSMKFYRLVFQIHQPIFIFPKFTQKGGLAPWPPALRCPITTLCRMRSCPYRPRVCI